MPSTEACASACLHLVSHWPELFELVTVDSEAVVVEERCSLRRCGVAGASVLPSPILFRAAFSIAAPASSIPAHQRDDQFAEIAATLTKEAPDVVPYGRCPLCQ